MLIVQPAFLGDVVLTTCLIEACHAAGYTVDFLLRRGNEGLLSAHPFVSRLLVWDKRQAKYRNWYALLKDIRSTRYHALICPHRYASTGAWLAFSRAALRIGFRQNPLSFAFTHRFEHRFDDELHETERMHRLLPPLGINGPALRPKLYPCAEDQEAVAKYKHGGRGYVTMAPGSVWYTKRLPPERWVELIERTQAAELDVYLLGGPDERRLCEGIATASGHRVEVLAGRLSLLSSAALMAGARMNYVNDSAPLHLASAMNAPVTAFFLNTAPTLGFGPLSERSYILEHDEPLACRPCARTGREACPLGHFKCAQIDPTPTHTWDASSRL